MASNVEVICCGDTEFCGECTLLKTFPEFSNADTSSLTLNAQGRCDFYNGPSHTKIDTRTMKKVA